FVWFVEYYEIADTFQLKIFALLVFGVEGLHGLKSFAKAEWLHQPVRDFLAVGRVVMLEYHLSFVFDGFVDPAEELSHTQFQELFRQLARLRGEREHAQEVLLQAMSGGTALDELAQYTHVYQRKLVVRVLSFVAMNRLSAVKF